MHVFYCDESHKPGDGGTHANAAVKMAGPGDGCHLQALSAGIMKCKTDLFYDLCFLDNENLISAYTMANDNPILLF